LPIPAVPPRFDPHVTRTRMIHFTFATPTT
jgi:hypothetical protein